MGGARKGGVVRRGESWKGRRQGRGGRGRNGARCERRAGEGGCGCLPASRSAFVDAKGVEDLGLGERGRRELRDGSGVRGRCSSSG